MVAVCDGARVVATEKQAFEVLGPPLASTTAWLGLGATTHEWKSSDGRIEFSFTFEKGRFARSQLSGCPSPAARLTADEALRSIETNDEAGLNRLLDDGLDVDATGGRFDETLLGNAILLRRPAMARLLLRRGANPLGAKSRSEAVLGMKVTPLWRAANVCDVESAQLLLERGGTLDAPLLAALTPAAGVKGCSMLVLSFLERGADANATMLQVSGAPGHPALTLALLTDQPALVEALLARQADPNRVSFGRTPLAHAIEHFPVVSNFDAKRDAPVAARSMKCLELLISAGARRDAKTADGKTFVQLVGERFASLDDERADSAGRAFYAKQKQRLLQLLSP